MQAQTKLYETTQQQLEMKLISEAKLHEEVWLYGHLVGIIWDHILQITLAGKFEGKT